MNAQIEVLPAGAPGRTGFLAFQWPTKSSHRLGIATDLLWGLPTVPAASVQSRDMFRIAAAAYIADAAVPKPAVSLHRDFRLLVHVEDPSHWDVALTRFASLLYWLTGDAWSIELAQATSSGAQNQTLPASRVQLLSGGLDSLCGAIIGLRDGVPTTFIGHRDASKPVRHAQNVIRDALAGAGVYETHELFLRDPRRKKNSGPRSRSLMFMALGILTAEAAGASELWVPENGFTSINPPLDAARGGTLTTRSTHPFTFHLVRLLLADLGIATGVRNPFDHLTKGELVAAASPELLGEVWGEAAATSFSCAKGGTQFYGGNSYHNCGLCVACVIRRGGYLRGAGSDPTIYDCLALTGNNLLGLEQHRAKDVTSLASAASEGIPEELILSSASWPPGTDFDAVLDLVGRGLEEIALVPLPTP